MRLRVRLPEKTYDWESSAVRFCIGRGESCALRIEGESAKFASWEHAEVSFGDDGVPYVTDLASSNGTYVDGVRIGSARRLRIGSELWLGRAGPRIEVLELAPAVSRPVQVVTTTPLESVAAARPPRAAGRETTLRYGVVLVAIAVALLAAAGLLWPRAGNQTQPLPANPPVAVAEVPHVNDPDVQPQASGTKPAEPPRRDDNDEKDDHAAPDTPEPPAEPKSQTDEPLPQPPAADDLWKVVAEKGLAAYRLIAVEDPQTRAAFPLADAVVVGERTLLTTADAAIEIAKFLQRGWQITARRSSHDTGVRLDGARVHAAFQNADPGQQLYFDWAVLYATESLGNVAMLAPATELAGLERGQPLACIAVDNKDEAIDRFQELQPQSHPAKVFAMRGLSPEAGAPRILLLRGSLNESSSGGPIFDDRGQLVALYCEAAPADGAARSGTNTHYAKIIEPSLIALALSRTENQVWVTPVVPSTDPPTQEPVP